MWPKQDKVFSSLYGKLHRPVMPFSGRQAPLGDKIFSHRDNYLASNKQLP